MKFVFDIQDEQDILRGMLCNQHKAISIGRTCMQQGKSKQAVSWIASAHQIGVIIMLLEQAFHHKN